jgi:hypothetical protein
VNVAELARLSKEIIYGKLNVSKLVEYHPSVHSVMYLTVFGHIQTKNNYWNSLSLESSWVHCLYDSTSRRDCFPDSLKSYVNDYGHHKTLDDRHI